MTTESSRKTLHEKSSTAMPIKEAKRKVLLDDANGKTAALNNSPISSNTVTAPIRYTILKVMITTKAVNPQIYTKTASLINIFRNTSMRRNMFLMVGVNMEISMRNKNTRLIVARRL